MNLKKEINKMGKILRVIGTGILGLSLFAGCRNEKEVKMVSLEGTVLSEEYRPGGVGHDAIDELYTIKLKTKDSEKTIHIHSALRGYFNKKKDLTNWNNNINPGSRVRVIILNTQYSEKEIDTYSNKLEVLSQ